ncbi:MAG: Holliday junction resolvase RuvX [Negativicutes bacterium]|nr:Holliday junction resolvase RuvX [Negativicutes bacterium]
MIKDRVIGLDVGSKRIGIAISDPFGWTAQPVMTLHRTELSDDLAKINELIIKENAKSLVLGLPKNMDGSVGFQGEEVRAFSEELKAVIDPQISISFWDERLSSVAAERILIEGNVSRKKRKGVIDKMAAVVILQTYLDSVSQR